MAVPQLPGASFCCKRQVHRVVPRVNLEEEEERGCILPAVVLMRRQAGWVFALTLFLLCPLCFPGCLPTSASADLTLAIGIEFSEPPSPALPRGCRSRVSGKLRRSASALGKGLREQRCGRASPDTVT